jgi:hypothetical protein
MGLRQSLGQGKIGLLDQRTLNSTELVIARHRKLSPATDTSRQLLKRERQKGQRLTGISVTDQPGDQFRVHFDISKSGRSLDHRDQRSPA